MLVEVLSSSGSSTSEIHEPTPLVKEFQPLEISPTIEVNSSMLIKDVLCQCPNLNRREQLKRLTGQGELQSPTVHW